MFLLILARTFYCHLNKIFTIILKQTGESDYKNCQKSVQNTTLMIPPSLASDTANSSCMSLDATFFSIFFNVFDILPSTAAVAAIMIRTQERYLENFGYQIMAGKQLKLKYQGGKVKLT